MRGQAVASSSCTSSPPIVGALRFLPGPRDVLAALSPNATQAADADFALFANAFCQLPAANNSSPTQHHWRNTVGKFYIGWVRALHDSTRLHTRYVIPPKILNEKYIFPPHHTQCPLLHPDVCAHRATRSPNQAGGSFSAPAHSNVGWSNGAIYEATRNIAGSAGGSDGDDHLASSGQLSACHKLQNLISSAFVAAGRYLRLAAESRGTCKKRAGANRLAQVARIGVEAPPDAPRIAMHVRRGDSCERFITDDDLLRNEQRHRIIEHERRQYARSSSSTDSNHGQGGNLDSGNSSEGVEAAARPCLPLRTYIRAAHELRRRYGAIHILIATDSESVIGELPLYTADGFSFEYKLINRTTVGGRENASLGGGEQAVANSIENRVDADRDYIFESVHADMELLSRAHMFIGTGSVSSRLMLLSIAGRRGAVPPFILVDPLADHGVGSCLGCVTCFQGLPSSLPCLLDDPMHM